jgi:hypothetical protein
MYAYLLKITTIHSTRDSHQQNKINDDQRRVQYLKSAMLKDFPSKHGWLWQTSNI